MNYNTFLERFGLNPDDFVNKEPAIIHEGNSIIYEVTQDTSNKFCPICGVKGLIKDHSWTKISLNTTIGLEEEIRIYKTRFYCPICKKSFTPSLRGIERHAKISNITKEGIIKEFRNVQSFSSIASRYQLSTTEVIKIFDKEFKYIPRLPLPEYLCIDEKHFEGDTEGKYCVVISDFFTGEIVDVIQNRQIAYLEAYFDKVSLRERDKVKVFITDMYDGYLRIKNKYFPKALFVIDLFHVIKQLTDTVKKIRIRTYNQYVYEESLERHFMKQNWKSFLCDLRKICNKAYYSRKYDTYISYGDIIMRCVKKNNAFWDGYNILQDLFTYKHYESYEDAERFINWIISRLKGSGDELLIKVGKTYSTWKVGIINGLSKRASGKRLTNAIAESNNSHIQRIIDVAYGYKNFDRFRKRILIIRTYKKGS